MSGAQQVLLGLKRAVSGGPPTFVAAETARRGADLTISKPAGTVDNDVMLALIGSASTGVTPPAGWTEIETVSVHQPYFRAYRKVASGEGASYAWTGADEQLGAILTFRGVNTTTPVDIDGSGTFTAVNNPSAPSVTTTVANTVVVAVQTNNDSGNPATPPSGMTERVDLSDAVGNFSISVATVAQAASGASGAKQFALSFSATGVAYTVALLPA